MKLDRALGTLGTVAACSLVVCLNILGSQYFRRWDLTSDHRYTLSTATKQTLRDLREPVEAWVLLSRTDPLEAPIRQLLDAYRAETRYLDLRVVDPDREPLELLAVRKRFGIETAKIEDGRILTDAVVVFSKGDRHWFVTANELYENGTADGSVKPHEERALTRALRSLDGSAKLRLCFTEGHGEMRLDDASERGLGHLRSILEKENFELRTIDLRSREIVSPLKGCDAVIISRPAAAFSADEDARLRTYLLGGGNLFLGASPIFAPGRGADFVPLGLDTSLAPFGIRLENELVVETEPHLVTPEQAGLEFVALPKAHAISDTLVPNNKRPETPRVIVRTAALLTRVGEGDAREVLSTSERAETRAVVDGPRTGRTGPFTIGLASERARIRPSDSHGPRVVVLGSGSVFAAENWQTQITEHGAAFLTENAIAWLAARPDIVDVPERPAVGANVHWTEATRIEVRNYVLLWMPLAVALLGAMVLFYRRSNERSVRDAKGAKPARKRTER